MAGANAVEGWEVTETLYSERHVDGLFLWMFWFIVLKRYGFMSIRVLSESAQNSLQSYNS